MGYIKYPTNCYHAVFFKHCIADYIAGYIVDYFVVIVLVLLLLKAYSVGCIVAYSAGFIAGYFIFINILEYDRLYSKSRKMLSRFVWCVGYC